VRQSIKTLLAVLLTVMSFSAVQTVWAEDDGWLTVTGTIIAEDREISTITIEGEKGEIVIKGFPFGYFEREMAVTRQWSKLSWFAGAERVPRILPSPLIVINAITGAAKPHRGWKPFPQQLL